MTRFGIVLGDNDNRFTARASPVSPMPGGNLNILNALDAIGSGSADLKSTLDSLTQAEYIRMGLNPITSTLPEFESLNSKIETVYKSFNKDAIIENQMMFSELSQVFLQMLVARVSIT